LAGGIAMLFSANYQLSHPEFPLCFPCLSAESDQPSLVPFAFGGFAAVLPILVLFSFSLNSKRNPP
jgi:hypothetical protein